MVNTAPRTAVSRATGASVSYERVQAVITPEAPDHYTVEIRDERGKTHTHAVERVVINTAEVYLREPIWFVDAAVDVGIPEAGHDEVVWVWA